MRQGQSRFSEPGSSQPRGGLPPHGCQAALPCRPHFPHKPTPALTGKPSGVASQAQGSLQTLPMVHQSST